jgi:predicted nucleic acid-binding protein
MPRLCDTNVLLRCIDTASPQQPLAAKAIAELLAAGEEVCVAHQNLYEFWVVATRPKEKNGLGLTPAQALVELGEIEKKLLVLSDNPDVYYTWRELVEAHDIKGLPAHDARLAATMLVHGVDEILTFNAEHFRRFPMIKVFEPK